MPVNYALTGEELAYLLEQSGSRAVLFDPKLQEQLDPVLGRPPARSRCATRRTRCSRAPPPATCPRSTPIRPTTTLVQLLYTSGTTSRPKGAMMTHRALVHEYASCVVALDMAEDDDPLHCMPLYHSAGMHVFLLPSLAVGATNALMEAPDVPEILRRIEEDGIGSLFLAPTVWVPLANHPDLDARDLSALRKAYYGASIMPVPILERLQERLPELGFYNCFGQSEIAPLATVLRPEEHDGAARLVRALRAVRGAARGRPGERR